MENQQDNLVIKVNYETAPEFIMTYACGCHGGITPNGDLQMNFFEDRIPIPINTTLEIKHGKASEDKVKLTEFQRIVKCSITYKRENILSLINWLQLRYKELESSRIIENAGGDVCQ